MSIEKSQKSHGVRYGECSACCGSGWHFVLRQKLLICDIGVTKHIVVFVCLFLSFFEKCFFSLRMRRQVSLQSEHTSRTRLI